MRPIDAEPLEYLFGISDEDNFVYLMLKNAPTLDVISVEWLREKMNIADDAGDLDSADLISWLIQTWQKEQEE